MKEKILIYPSTNLEKGTIIKDVLKNTYDIKIISDNELYQTIGYLFELEGFDKKDDNEQCSFPFDIMIFPMISHDEIKKISTLLKEQAVDIERKAMLTQPNRHWTIEALLKEVDVEHTYFKKRSQLNQLLLDSTKIKPEDIKAELIADFQKAVLFAYDTLQDKESTSDVLEKAINDLLPLYQKVQ